MIVLVPPDIVPLFEILPVNLWLKEDALKVVAPPIVLLPVTFTLLFAFITSDVPVVEDVRFPEIVNSEDGSVLTALPVPDDNTRLPYV